MNATRHALFARLAPSCLLLAALTAQSTGRAITNPAAANLGTTAQFVASYPGSAAGNLGWFVCAGHQAGTVPLPTLGFTVHGDCRVNPSALLQSYPFLLDGTGASALALAVPNAVAFLSFPFDVQTLDVDLAASEVRWSDNDVEVVVGPGAQSPLPSANFVVIPAGSFAMGSNLASGAPYYPQPNERPVHTVTIARPFWIGRYEVTQAEYQAVMGTNPSFYQGASFPNSGSRPVEQVSYSEAMAYCAARTAAESAAGRLPAGYQYRLPTEAEWEYCCRAGTTTEWNTGATLSAQQANSNAAGIGQTVNVGSYAANAFGLFDTHGNVWEWCLDAWDGSNNYTPAAVADPYGIIGSPRVVRGGAWYGPVSYCRSAFRSNYSPISGRFDIGFRVVLAPIACTPLPNFVAIPAGLFGMGSPTGSPDQRPVHQVTFARPFWMGKFEVTQAEYQAVVGSNPSYFQGANRPVEQVSWNDAMAYCAALTSLERAAGRVAAGYQYRLPTEAEWEYCCRAGTVDEFNTGPSLSTQQANFGSGGTVNVGSYAANPFGLYDTHGNIWEWCLDAWDRSNNYPASAVSDPYVTSGAYRILRGGSWIVTADVCRSAYRVSNLPNISGYAFGFRVVLAPALVP